MNTCLWLMFGKIQIIHPSHKWLPPTFVMWATQLTTVDLGLFQDSDFAGDFEGSKSTKEGVLCIFGIRTFCPPSVRCVRNKRQYPTVLQKTEIISLDAGLRMEELLAPDLWDVVMEVLCSTNSTKTPIIPASGNRCEGDTFSRNTSKCEYKENRDVDHLLNMDYVTTNTHSSQGESQLYIFEDSKAVIKMIIKARSPTMRHVWRTHKVALDWLFDRINLDPKMRIKFVVTKNELLDMLTFTRDEWFSWIPRCPLLAISFFQTEQKHSPMAMRGPEGTSGEGSSLAKPKFLNVVMAKPRLVNLVLLNLLSARKIYRKMWAIPTTRGTPKRNKAVLQLVSGWKQMQSTNPKSAEYSHVRNREDAPDADTWKQEQRSDYSDSNKRLETNAECGHKHE